MDLKEFSSGTPATKPWLNIVCNDMKCHTAEADIATIADLVVTDLSADELTLVNQAGVPNPAVGSRTLYTDLSGVIHTQDPLGASLAYFNHNDPVVQVTPASAVIGNIPVFATSDGKMVTDSGSSASAVFGSLAAVEDQAIPIAPAGQRDTWQASAFVAPGGTTSFVYVKPLDLFIASDTGAAQYSTDGGVTFNNCAFDVATAGYTNFGSNPAGLIVCFSSTGDYYTSTDGINFTHRGSNPAISPNSFQMTWFNNLFIMSDLLTAGQAIVTSPDGLAWTSHAFTPIMDTFDSNSTIAVGFANVAPYAFYSTDGITWHDSPTPLSQDVRSPAYSPEQKMWTALTRLNGHIYTSIDGISWTLSPVGLGPTGTTTGLTWVPELAHWYVASPDPKGHIGLWSSPNPAQENFANVSLQGSVAPSGGLQSAPVYYRSAAKSFVMGVYSGIPATLYSAPRPYAMIPLDDMYQSNGGYQVRSWRTNYAQAENAIVASSAAELTLILASGVGYLTIPANALEVGSTYSLKVGGSLSSVAGTATVTIHVKLGGTVIAQTTITPTIGGGGFALDAAIQFRVIGAAGKANSVCGFSTQAQTLMTGVTINTTIANAFDVTAQWSVADALNSISTNILSLVRQA
jgi:hypothetical protein